MEKDFCEFTKRARWCLGKCRENVANEMANESVELTPQSWENMVREVNGCLRRIKLVIAELVNKFNDAIERLRKLPSAPLHRLACHVVELPRLFADAIDQMKQLASLTIQDLTRQGRDPKNEVLALIKHVELGLEPAL